MSEAAPGPFVIAALTVLMLSALGAPAAQAAGCRPCEVALERCSAHCSGLAGEAESLACLIGCENAAATCTSCDEKGTLRSEDLLPASLALAAACHSTTPCSSTYGSCANWSGYSACGETVCGYSATCSNIATKQYRERYRVCFNAQGRSCTEYQRTLVTLGCGC